tara:strand:- start:4732 stop:5961 length:1230 start_codon:yes stop_codon:yes gene_type:complete
MRIQFLRKVSNKPASTGGGVTSSQLGSVESKLSQVESKLSQVEDDLVDNETADSTVLSRVTALETSQGTQDTEIADLSAALNSAGSNRRYLIPLSATATVTATGGITTASTLFTITNGHTSGDGWKIEFYHQSYTSGNWVNTNVTAPSGTQFLVRAVKTDGTLLSSTTTPRFLGWTGTISGSNNAGAQAVTLGSSDATVGAAVTTSTGEEITYSVNDDAGGGSFTLGSFSGKVEVTISGWTNTYAGSGAPVADAFYRLDSWWDNNHGGDTSHYKSYHPASKHNYKMQMNWGDTGQTGYSYWDYPLGDGANNGDDGYPQINWSPSSIPASASDEEAIIGPSSNRIDPTEGDNEYTFTIDLSDNDKVGNSTDSIRIGFRAYAQGSGWVQGWGQYWVKVEPVSGEGTYTPPS